MMVWVCFSVYDMYMIRVFVGVDGQKGSDNFLHGLALFEVFMHGGFAL